MIVVAANNFPHTAGLVSRDDSLAGLAVGLCMLYNVRFEPQEMEKYSISARLSSESACRGVFGGAVKWLVGFDPCAAIRSEHKSQQKQKSQDYSVPVKDD